jgi:hypothetical protein
MRLPSFRHNITESAVSKTLSILLALTGAAFGAIALSTLMEYWRDRGIFDAAERCGTADPVNVLLFLGGVCLALLLAARYFWGIEPAPEPIVRTIGEIRQSLSSESGRRADPSGVVYVARYTWRGRVIPLVCVVALGAFVPRVAARWQSGEWLYVVGFGAIAFFVAMEFVSTFVCWTKFTDAGIWRRSEWGRDRFLPYGQVQEIEVVRGEYLRVRFDSGQHLEVAAKEGDPEATVEAMSEFLDTGVRVTTY